MAGKKDKPALYELIGKGPLKPDGRGSIETPKWFYGQKSKTEPMRAGVQAIAIPKSGAGKPFIPQTVKQPDKVQVEQPVQQPEQSSVQPGQSKGRLSGQPSEKQPGLVNSAAISGVGAKVPAPSGSAFGKRLGNLDFEDRSAQTEADEAKDFSFGMEDWKIRLLFPFWVGCVVLLGLLFVMGVIYRFGQHSGKNSVLGPTESAAAGLGGTEQGGDGSTADMGSVPARPDVWDRPSSKETATGAGSSNRAVGSDSGRSGARYESTLPGGSGTATSPGDATSSRTGGASRAAPGVTTQSGGWRLILCGSTNQRDLVAVQEYFNRKGIITGIGKQSSRWVLFSDYSASSSSDAKLSELKAKVKELGAKYNSEKPRSATPFIASTFSSAFPVKDESITGKIGR